MSKRCSTDGCQNPVWPETRVKCVSCRKAQQNHCIQLRRSQGHCSRCGVASEINPRTGRPHWRCRHCRDEYKQHKLPPYRPCDQCGTKIRRVASTLCRKCDGGQPAARRTFTKPVKATPPRHVPSSIFLQQDLVKSRYAWAATIQRDPVRAFPAVSR